LYRERKELLSANYWLQNLFLDAPFVNIKMGFPDQNLSLPTVSVEWETIDSSPFELGNKTQVKEVKYSFDVFAKDTDQRNEFIFRVFNELDMGIPVYDYDEGFPPDVSPTRLGCLIPLRKYAKNIPVLPQLTKELYFRASITVVMTYDVL
jgi:hypothetical protein